jgi:plasmid stabilization system protein ParE
MNFDKYNVHVEPSADQKLAGHIEFLARVSESAAVRLYREYEKSLAFLAENPGVCPQYIPQKPIDAELKYTIFGRRYRIVFEIDGTDVFVYDIQDCRQDIAKQLI